jgi:alpha-glucuronidase
VSVQIPRIPVAVNTSRIRLGVLALLAMPLFCQMPAQAETGAEGWLRYAPISNSAVLQQYRHLPYQIVHIGNSPVARSAAQELGRALGSQLNTTMTQQETLPDGDAFVLGTPLELARVLGVSVRIPGNSPDGFTVTHLHKARHAYWVICGRSARAELYGVFRFVSALAQQQPLNSLDRLSDAPAAPIRWINQWDNFDGSIERGYAGRSIFFNAGHVRSDLSRAGEYARLLASVGINGVTVNNVNSDLATLKPSMLADIARIADVFRPWGVTLSLSVDLSSPKILGELDTFDPLDPRVIHWWQVKTDDIYRLIPDFGGFVVKADSEGRAGPSQYHRTPAEAANVLARALAPHRGIVLYRGFVYNHHLDYNDPKADRARAGYDNFAALDGKFQSNVVVQIKHGPIDFQTREPVSPLFAALRHTNQAVELQVTQEYTGQQRHLVYLVPMWKTALDTDLRADGRITVVRDILTGTRFQQPLGGFVAVANVGLDTNWLHHPLAMANLYGFARLAWRPTLSAEQIVEEWTRQTFGNDPQVVETIDKLQLESWHTYENYTGPLGGGTLTDILGVHYGPGIETADHNGWGQWIRAEHEGVGMDRTTATGTGYTGQYPPQFAATYESIEACPDELLLFMHHVPYDHVLHSGKTVIQHIYDSHYDGAATAATYAPRWSRLKGKIDEERYEQTLAMLVYQSGHANVWRDAIDQWFQQTSGIDDALHRVGNWPGRVEAESMTHNGYVPIDVHPWETASRGKAVACYRSDACTLTTTFSGKTGTYDIAIQYFDLRTGASSYELIMNETPVAHWVADDTLPPAVIQPEPNGHTSTRFTVHYVSLREGDRITLRGQPEGKEPAPVDYLEITPSPELTTTSYQGKQ